MKALQIFNLQFNDITGTIPSQVGLLSNLGKLTSLNMYAAAESLLTLLMFSPEQLVVARNRMSGALPSELANCAKLQQLYLGFNEFIGSIPLEYGTFMGLGTSELRWPCMAYVNDTLAYSTPSCHFCSRRKPVNEGTPAIRQRVDSECYFQFKPE